MAAKFFFSFLLQFVCVVNFVINLLKTPYSSIHTSQKGSSQKKRKYVRCSTGDVASVTIDALRVAYTGRCEKASLIHCVRVF